MCTEKIVYNVYDSQNITFYIFPYGQFEQRVFENSAI